MFTKIDKKILITLIIFLILIAAAVFFAYKYLVNNSPEKKITEEQEISSDISNTPEQTPNIKLQNPNIEIQGIGAATLTVCLDRCGDGVCQKTNDNCKDGNLNCICPETVNECPQDCSGN